MKLDRIDFEILKALQADARISNKELAEKNKISPSTCLERVRRLKEQGVLRSFNANVLPSALGIGVEAMISIRLRQHTEISFGALFQEISEIEEVINVYLLAGTVDFLVHVAVRDVQHLRVLVLDTFTARHEIARLETSIIFEFANRPTLPNYQPLD